jgi:hypothetical protein
MAPAWLEKFIVREDATPDSRRSSDQPILSIHYSALDGHRRILGVDGDQVPRYEVKRQAILGAWGSACHVTTPSHGDEELAVIDYHTRSIAIRFPSRQHQIDISTKVRTFNASGGLGLLHWKPTGMELAGRASWELRDETSLVMSVKIDEYQVNGMIDFWKEGLDAETVDELVVVSIAEIEGYKRMLQNAKKSATSLAANITWLAI